MERPLGTYRLPSTGEDVEISGRYLLDEGTGLVNGIQTYQCSIDHVPTRRIELPVRFHLIEPEKLDGLLELAGFNVVERLGSYTGEEFDPDNSDFYLVECRKT